MIFGGDGDVAPRGGGDAAVLPDGRLQVGRGEHRLRCGIRRRVCRLRVGWVCGIRWVWVGRERRVDFRLDLRGERGKVGREVLGAFLAGLLFGAETDDAFDACLHLFADLGCRAVTEELRLGCREFGVSAVLLDFRDGRY